MKSRALVFFCGLLFISLHGLAHDATPKSGISKADVEKLIKSLDGFKDKRYCGLEPQIFDVHLHYHAPTSDVFAPEQIIEILKKMGVRRALVGSGPNEETFKLYRLDPNLIVPEAMPWKSRDEDRDTWFTKPPLIDMIEELLTKGEYPFKGIGELHLQKNESIDSPLVRRVVGLARKHGLFIHPHTSAEGIKKLYAIDPKVKILWAHAGQNNTDPDPTAKEVGEIMAKHPGLMVEVAVNKHVAPNRTLDPNWKALFLKYSKRIMVGTDPISAERWQDIPKVVDDIKNWLCQLPQPIAEDLAWKTADRLISKDSKLR